MQEVTGHRPANFLCLPLERHPVGCRSNGICKPTEVEAVFSLADMLAETRIPRAFDQRTEIPEIGTGFRDGPEMMNACRYR